MTYSIKQCARALGAMVVAIPLSVFAFIAMVIVLTLRQPDDNPYLDEVDDGDD